MSVTAREAALKALAAFRKNGAWADGFLSALFEKNQLPVRETALASRICYGTIQNLGLCDFYISAFAAMPLQKMEPMVADILRISVYQLVFLSRIPFSAAVNEGVKLAKKYANPRAVGFVNAVLRRVSENVGHLPDVPRTDIREYLSVQYSHPRWLVDIFCSQLGEAGCEALLAAHNADVPVTAQVNTLTADTEALLAELTGSGLSAEKHEWLPDAIQISDMGNLEHVPAFQAGKFYVQDAAARMAVMAAGAAPGMRVIDACAAPGGKSFAAAVAMHDSGRITACDIQARKLRHIEAGAARLGLQNIETLAADGRVPVTAFQNAADIVIADVPCSGLGVIRKKPEIRYKSPESLAGLPVIQTDILQNLADYVRPGGVLLYSTCTVLPQENAEVIRKFLEKRCDFVTEAFTLPCSEGRADTGMITLWPQIHGTDGFFICKLRRSPEK